MPISVRALFFAAHRDLVGAPEVTVALPQGARVSDLVAELTGRGNPFARLPANPAVAVNRAYAGLDSPLADGDEVAFIPPVAGG